MMKIFQKTFMLILLFLTLPVSADLLMEDAWSRASPPMARSGAVYGTLKNSGPEAVTITEVKYSGAGRSEIHNVFEEAGVMKMRSAMPLTLEPGTSITLEPGATHIMLMGLKAPLEEGGSLVLELVTDSGTVDVNATVGAIGQMTSPDHAHHHHH